MFIVSEVHFAWHSEKCLTNHISKDMRTWPTKKRTCLSLEIDETKEVGRIFWTNQVKNIYKHISWHLCSFLNFPTKLTSILLFFVFKAPFWSRSSHVGCHGSCGKRGDKCGRSCERREGNRHCGKQRCQVWFFGRDELWLPRVTKGFPRVPKRFPRVPKGFPRVYQGYQGLPRTLSWLQ